MRLLTYNIHKGIGGHDRRYRFERIVRVLQEQEPDLICLQEVAFDLPRVGGVDQSRLLGQSFPEMHVLYQKNVFWRIGGYGNVVLSRWPFVSTHHVALQMERRKPRGAQLAVVQTSEGYLHVVNWHLGLNEAERHWQVDHLLHHPVFQHSLHLPTLIVGDSNDWRNSLEIGALARHEFRQVTAPAKQFRSFPAFISMMALDKVFSRGEVAVEQAQCVRSALTRRASDHLPLVVDFHLNGRPLEPSP